MQKFSDEELVDIIDSFGFDKDTYVRLKARLERGRKAIEAMEKAKRLCDVIVNSHPDRMIKGEIESMAFELSTYLNLLLKEEK